MGAFTALGGLASKAVGALGKKIGQKMAGKAGGQAAGQATGQTGTDTDPSAGSDDKKQKKQPQPQKQQQPQRAVAMIPSPERTQQQPLASFKKGGRVRKTGLYRLHAGEFVVPAKSRSGGKKAQARKRTLIKL